MAGQAALDRPDWTSRIVMFRLYYLGLAPYENARHFLGLSERSWMNWSEEIRPPAAAKNFCAAACSRQEGISRMVNDDAAEKTQTTNDDRHVRETGLEVAGVAGWTA
jgi:hypothetical protein